MDCIFCKIVAGELPAKKVYEDEHVVAFHDINPVAPVHVLVIPKEHHQNVLEMADPGQTLLHVHRAVQKVVVELGIAKTGFRIITNTGEHAQQTVFHTHFHVIGGRQLSWDM